MQNNFFLSIKFVCYKCSNLSLRLFPFNLKASTSKVQLEKDFHLHYIIFHCRNMVYYCSTCISTVDTQSNDTFDFSTAINGLIQCVRHIFNGILFRGNSRSSSCSPISFKDCLKSCP